MRSSTYCLAAMVACAVALPTGAYAQPTADASAPVVIAELDALETRTMTIAISGSTTIGSQILGNSRMMAGRTAELTVLDGQMASALPIYGRARSWERVGDRRIGTQLVRRRYIVQHENMLTVWYLTYIKLDRGWEVAGINFNDQIQGLNDDW